MIDSFSLRIARFGSQRSRRAALARQFVEPRNQQPLDDPTGPEKLARAQMIFEGLQEGTIDRSLFTDNANFYFNDEALKNFSSSLGPLGTPEEFVEMRQELRGGMKLRAYSVKCPKISLLVWAYEMPNGTLEEYLVFPQN